MSPNNGLVGYREEEIMGWWVSRRGNDGRIDGINQFGEVRVNGWVFPDDGVFDP